MSRLMSLLLLVLFAGCQPQTTATKENTAASEPIGIGHSLQFPSSILSQQRTLNIYLPASYHQQSTQKYPLLLLLDGGLHEDFHHITGIAQWAALTGSYQEVIVVGIANIDRKHDLTSPSDNELDKKELPTHGGAAKFRTFISEELLPWLQQQYRISDRRLLLGESLAGLFTTETFLLQPEMFTDYIAISPSLWWNDMKLSLDAEKHLQNGDYANRRLWLAMADEGGDMRTGYQHLINALKAMPESTLHWQVTPFAEEKHNTIYHPAATKAVRDLLALQATGHPAAASTAN